MFRTWLTAVVLALSTSAFATDATIDLKTLAILGFHVGTTTTLADIVARLGPTKQWQSGDAATAGEEVCYRLALKNGEAIVAFWSFSEESDPEGQLNSIIVFGPGSIYKYRNRCAAITVSSTTIAADNGLTLGLTRQEVRAILGRERLTKDGIMEYVSCTKRYLNHSDPAFQMWAGQMHCFEDPSRPYVKDCAYIWVRFKNGRVSSFGLNANQNVC